MEKLTLVIGNKTLPPYSCSITSVLKVRSMRKFKSGNNPVLHGALYGSSINVSRAKLRVWCVTSAPSAMIVI